MPGFSFAAYLSYCILWDTISGVQILKTDEYDAWFRRLRDPNAKARINARLKLCETAGRPTGDLHPVGDGVSELRFHFGSGYRVYFAQKGDTLMLLLAGGDKNGQSRDIKRAQRMLDQLRKDKQW